MNKTSTKIRTTIRELARKPNEIISGIMVAGSLNTSANTISVQPSGGGKPIEGVLLNSFAGNNNGLMLFPADNSHVIIGSIDGPGEWGLISASEITKAIITIGSVVYNMDESQVNIQNGNVVFNISDGLFKINAASESLYSLLNDLVTAITVLTVSTTSGPSGVPNNVADFSSILTRLNNLLTN